MSLRFISFCINSVQSYKKIFVICICGGLCVYCAIDNLLTMKSLRSYKDSPQTLPASGGGYNHLITNKLHFF